MSSDAPAPPSADPVTRGQALLESNDFHGALALFNEALRANPSNFLATFERARCHQGLGNWADAIQGYTEALRLDGSEPATWLNRGSCRGGIADHEGAAEDLERYLEKRPDRGDVWMDLGDRRLDAGQYARAAEAYEKAVALLPAKAQDLAPWIERGRTLDRLKSSGPKTEFAAACRERGWGKFQAGGYRTAGIWFNRAIDAVPEDAEAWHGRGSARGRLGQTAEALADLEKSVKLSPESAPAWVDLGSARSAQGDAAGALAAAEEAIRRKPDATEAYFVRGLARGKLGDFAAAEADFTRFLEAFPKDSLGWLNRGWARRRAGRPREAIPDLDRSIELDPHHPMAYYNRGFARRDLGETPASVEDFRKAMSLDPTLAAELTPLVQGTSPAPPPPPPPSPVPAPPPAPAPAYTPQPAKEWTGMELLVMGVILIGIHALGVARIPYLGGIQARALDFPYKAAWVVAHWTDEVAFPHECNLCMEPFCTRTDVDKKHVCGRPGYTSQTRWRYCPAHEAGLLRTDTRLDAFVMIFYMGLALILGAMTVVLAVVFVVRIVLLPVTAVLAVQGKVPARALWPLLAEEDTWLYTTDMRAAIAGLGLFVVMLVMYIIW